MLDYALIALGVPDARIGVEWDVRPPTRYVTVNGVPAYEIGPGCGTCGLVLRREGNEGSEGSEGRAGLPTPDEVRDRLNAGLDGLDPDVVAAFGACLPAAEYLVMLRDVAPRLVTPGSAEDYFAVESPALFDERDPVNTSYYRLGRQARRLGEHEELFEFVVPMTEPELSDLYLTVGDAHPTAVALGLLEIVGPFDKPDAHWGLFHFLLDGHHKTAAAAAAGRAIRLLTFVSTRESLASRADLNRLPGLV